MCKFFVVSALALGAICAVSAEDLSAPASGDAVEINIYEDSTLTVSNDVEYGTIAITGSGKLTLAGEGKITAGSVAIAKGITLVNGGQLNSAPVSVGTNGVFEIAAPMSWSSEISGLGGVRVSADEVVFAKQNTFTGGFTVAPGGRARSDVGASQGGGGGGGFGGVKTWDSSFRVNRFYGNVTVESGGAVDMVHNHYTSCYSLILAGTGIEGCGAAYRSGGISDAENQPHAKSITLTDDATVSANNAWGLIAPSYKKTELNLSEHALTITGASNFLLCNTKISGTGTIQIADGATLKIIKSGTVASSAACRIKSGGRFYTKQGTTTFANVACEAGSTMVFEDSGSLKVTGALELPSDGYATLDISAVHVAADTMRTLIQCSSVTADTDISRLRVTGKANCQLKAVAGGIVVEHAPNVLTWSNGSWNYATLEAMQNFNEATVVLSEGENVVEMPGDLSFEEITVSAAAAGSASFSNGMVTVNELFLEENVTFVNNDNLAADAILMSSNSIFTVAQSTEYLGAIMGDGTVTVADGGALEVTNATSVAAALQLQSGATLKIAAEIEGDVTNAIPVAVGSLVLPGEGFATIDITDIPDLVSGVSQTLIACPGIAADMDISHLHVAGKSDCYLVAVEGVGIAVEYVPSLVWSDGSWNYATLEEMQNFNEATIMLSEGSNTVELPGDLMFDRVTVTADAAASAATASFSGHTATVGELVLGEDVTFVNSGLLNSAPVSVATNAVFEIAAPMTWSHAISGEGGVRVSADEVVFAVQSTFKGGLKVAAGGRARTTVSATAGGGYGGTKSGGRFTGNVTVESGGAVDMANCYDCSYYSLSLAGTGIAGSGAAYLSCGVDNPQDKRQAKSIALTDDATVRSDDAWGLIPSNFDAVQIDLNGHTLSITGTNNFLLGSTEISGKGIIEVDDGATLKATGRVWENNNATCSIKDGGGLYVDRYPVSFSNFVCEAGSKITFGDVNRDNETLQAGDTFALPAEGFVTIDISAMPDVDAGGKLRLIKCGSITTATDISCLHVTGKTDYRLKAEAGRIVAVRLPSDLTWSGGSWNVGLEDMSRYNEATIVLSEGTNEVAVADGLDFDSVSVSATAPGTLLFTGGTAEIGGLDLGENVTYVHTGTVSNNVVYVRSGAGIASECDGLVADAVSLAMGTTVYRGAKTVNASTISVSTGDVVPMSSAPRLRGNGGESTVLIRNTTGEDPSGLWRVVGGRWSEPRPDADVFVFEPELPQDAGDRVVADDGLYFARASFTASTGEVSAHESAQDAADAAKGKGGKVTVLAGGESISLGAGWFSTGASIIVPAGVVGVTVTVAGIVIGGKDSGDDGSKQYDEEEEARAEVVETGKKYSSLALAKSHMGDEPCTFRLLAESRDSIHLATASEESGQTLLLNNWPYSGTVTGASANLAAGASVKSYYAILSAAKSAWASGDTINLLSDGERYSVPNGKTLVLDGEKTYAVAKPFDLSGTLTVGGCTFTASAGITINAGTLKAAKANCTLIGSGTEVTLREGGVKVDTDGYSADVAAALTVAGGLQNKPVILKAGLADLRLSGGVVGDSVITIQSGCGKVFAPASSDCEPGDYTQISEQDAKWATFENGIAVANLVKADGSSTAYSSINAAGAAAQLNPTYRYIEVLVNNQTLRCLPTMGVIRVKYDNAVFVFKVQSIAQDWTFDEVYGVVYSVFTPVHKATDYVWNGGEDGDWETITNWKYNLALDYDLPIATRIPDTNDTVIIRADGMPESGWSACIGSSGGACKEIKVDEGAKLTLSYSSLGCDMTKTDPGVIIVTNAWTSGTPTITVKAGGGTVTLPKTAAYARGTDTVVVTETDDTVTLGFAGDITDPYAAWAAENGITGAWDEADADGIYNVFRYVFDKATGKFTIIDISFNAEGDVVITTAKVGNTEGFEISVIETSDVAGKEDKNEKKITSSSNTAIFEKSAPSRFYRLKAEPSKP